MNDPARVEQLFNEALQRANHIERHVFLTGACGDETGLWNEVWDRLRNRPPSRGGRRKTRGIKVAKAPAQCVGPEKPGDLIGPYRLLQIIDSNACGATWMAERNQRVTDLVTIRIVSAPANEFLTRFEEQKHALALLDHPGVVKSHASGMTSAGSPYLVADIVQGTPITAFCDDQKLPLLKRLRLFVQACDIMHHAHQKGVVHGQLNPACLLASWEDGEPVLKITDFGLAKAMNHSLAMPDGRFRTPTAYLSPEHVTGGIIDVRSDIHSLGALLYELLTGRQPFALAEEKADNPDELRRLMCETLVPKPSACLAALPKAQLAGVSLSRRVEASKMGALMEEHFDAIVMRALEKRPLARYATISALAGDLQRYLEEAAAQEEKPQMQGSALGSFIRDHRGVCMLAALLLLGFMTVLALVGGLLLREKQEEKKIAAGKKEESHSLTARFLQEMFASLTPEKVKGHDTTLIKNMLDEATDDLDVLVGNPEAGARTQETIGLTYLALSQPADAQKQLQGALDKRKLVLGGDHRDTLRSMKNLAVALKEQGRHADAELLLRQTLAVQQRKFGPDHTDTFVTITVLAAVCDAQEKHLEAETLYLNLWQLQKRVLGPDHLDTLATIGNLAASYSAQGRVAETMKLREEQLAATQRICGARAPQTLVAMNITAEACEAGGMPSQAEKLYFGALEIMTQALGAEHPDTLVQTDRAAMMLGRCGRHNDALRLHRQSLEAKQRVLGKQDPQTLLSMKCVAHELEAQGKPAEAEATQQNVLEVLKTAFPPEHPEILAQMDTLAQVYDSHGRHTDAVNLRQQTLAPRQRELGASHPQTLRSMQRLADSLAACGKPDAAEKLQLQVLDTMKAAYGPGDPDVLAQMHAVAFMHDLHGKHALAAQVLQEELQIQQRALGVEHAESLATMTSLAEIYRHAGKLEEAEKLLHEVLELRRKHASQNPRAIASASAQLGGFWLQTGRFAEAETLLRECLDLTSQHSPDHWLRFSVESLLGGALLGQKKYAEAGTLLRSGYEGLQSRANTLAAAEAHQLRDALERLAQFMEATGGVAEATVWKQKLAEFDQARQ